MSKEKFLPFLINILNETDYVGVVSIRKNHSKWTFLEDKEIMKPFLDWFTNCITNDNCLTTDEITIYHELKCKDLLISEEYLDKELLQYFNLKLSDDSTQTKFAIEVAEKELEALKSLEKFLNKQDRKIDSEKVIDELDPLMKSELKELETLNLLYNEAINKFSHSWDDLKCHLSQHHTNEMYINQYLNLISMGNQINQKLNECLKNSFQELKPTDGKINLSPLDYWVIFKKLSTVRDDITKLTANIEGKLVVLNYLKELEHLISCNPKGTSLSEINNFLSEFPNPNENLSELLSSILKEEVSCLVNIQINDTKKCSAFLEDRLGILNKLETIFQNKRTIKEVFKFIIKRDKIVHNFQLNKLNQFSKDIGLLVTQHEQNIESMRNHRSDYKVQSIDPNYKAMMKCLGLQISDFKALPTEIMNFKETLNKKYLNLEENLNLFQVMYNKRLNDIKEIDNVFLDGHPTREMFAHIFNNYKMDLQITMKKQEKIFEAFTKILKLLEEIKNGNSFWLKCLENPKDFLRRLYEMEKETERLRERINIEAVKQH